MSIDTEKWIESTTKKFHYSYIEIAFVLHEMKNKLFAEEVLRLSREKKICPLVMVPIVKRRMNVN